MKGAAQNVDFVKTDDPKQIHHFKSICLRDVDGTNHVGYIYVLLDQKHSRAEISAKSKIRDILGINFRE